MQFRIYSLQLFRWSTLKTLPRMCHSHISLNIQACNAALSCCEKAPLDNVNCTDFMLRYMATIFCHNVTRRCEACTLQAGERKIAIQLLQSLPGLLGLEFSRVSCFKHSLSCKVLIRVWQTWDAQKCIFMYELYMRVIFDDIDSLDSADSQIVLRLVLPQLLDCCNS